MPSEKILWHRVTETNDWEGEVWCHYFEDGDGVLSALESAMERQSDLEEVDTIELTMDQACALTNSRDDGYMQKHWFGELTNIEGLNNATEDQLYKGGIRDFGTELFE